MERSHESAADSEEAPGEPTRQPAAVMPERASSTPLILIADDEDSIAETIAMLVEDAGYLPLIATHGKEALELARTRHPALILTDLMMPYMDGLQLITALRADAAADSHYLPPIVLMTAGGLQRALQAGADAVLPKPFSLAQLEEILHHFLRP